MNLFFEIYGCEMNKSQAFSLRKFLEDNGHIIINDIKNADIIFIFTCSVRFTAEQRAYGRLHYFKFLKNQNPDLKVVILGCLAEQDYQLFEDKELADLILGTINHQYVLSFLESIELNKKIDNQKDLFQKTSSKTDKINFLNSHIDPSHPYKSFVTIIHGCSNFCSYCIVPYLRGKEISRNKDEIIEDIKKLVDKGVTEIVLLGQNVNAYGIDIDGSSFSELLNDVSKINGIELISFLSSHPKDFSDDLIDIVANNPKVSKLVHLPLQSGSDEILFKMNRKYDIKKYLYIIEKLKKENNEIQFSTDIIVGFPSESEQDFENTLEIVKKVRYLDIFSYRYSERKLKIKKYVDNIDEQEKLKRLSILIELKEKIGLELRKQQIGKIKKAIIVEDSKLDKNMKLFKTFDGFFGVIAMDEKPGTILNIDIKSISGNTLIA